MSAERRFMLLFACAALALVATGYALGGDGDVFGARVHDVRDASKAAPQAAIAPAGAGIALARPLITMDLRDRAPALETPPAPQPSLLADKQIVSYYGNPYSADMGVLGSDDVETVAAELAMVASSYDTLNGDAGVIPALHLVYAVAQYHAADDGLYLQYVDDAAVREYQRVAREHGMLLFLDLQIGRSSVEVELAKVLPYLRDPNVHLALDPEFAVAEGEVPGTALGSLRAPDINYAQEALSRLVRDEGLPPKLLMVHQFVDSMVLDGAAIRSYANVDLIIDMDGFGPADVKRVKYERYATQSYAAHAAIKLFLQHDPDLMSEQDVLALVPRPSVIIYQ